MLVWCKIVLPDADWLKHHNLEVLESRKVKFDATLLCRLIYKFFDFDVFEFTTISSNVFNVRGNGLKTVTENLVPTITVIHILRVAKTEMISFSCYGTQYQKL